jgi:hypothetical protein
MARVPSQRRWSAKVTETSDALDLKDNIFKSRSALHIAASLKHSAEQGSLGNLNDIEVHKRLAQRIEHPRRRSRKQSVEALAIGFIAGQEHQQIATCVPMAGNCPICQSSGIRWLRVGLGDQERLENV